MNLKTRLTAKITRPRLRAFLTPHATDTPVLEVGAKDRPYADLFPNAIAGDIVAAPGLNAQFDAHHLPFAAESVSLIVCTEVLEHCVNPHRVIAEFRRVLKPGGKLLLTTRFIFPLHDAPHDYFRFTKYGLHALCTDFAAVTVTEEAATVETMAVLMQRLANQVVWRVPGVKALLFGGAQVVVRLQGWVRGEYGDIRRQTAEQHILASGYYVVAVKS